MLDVLMHFEKFPQQKQKMQPSWIYTFWKFTNIPIGVECIHAMHLYWGGCLVKKKYKMQNTLEW